jgi:hypothetical protein
MERREFIKSGTSLAAAAVLGVGTNPLLSHSLRETKPSQLIGIQIGAPSFVDEGVEGCLDTIQKLSNANTLFAMTYSYKDGLSGRPWPRPDHGSQRQGPQFHGGYYATLNPKYYANTVFKNDPKALRAPDEGDFDLLASVIPAARERGIKTIAWFADQIHEEIPQFKEMSEIDLHGRKLNQVCFNNPHFTSLLGAMIEDCVRSYEIDGLLWRSERWGGLDNALRWNGKNQSSIPCFCPSCLEKGRKQGINTDKVREGFITLEQYVSDNRAGKKPAIGNYSEFWRILLRYPEILAWNMLWYDSMREIYKFVYTKVKAIKPGLQVGCAIPHSHSFNPFYRATVDLKAISKYNDFVKIILYHSDGGPRCCNYVDGMLNTYLRDLSRDDRLSFLYSIMGFSEGSYEKISANGLSADYVNKETKVWLEEAKGTSLQVLPGIDIDVSPGEGDVLRSRESVHDAVLAAFSAGASGVILSRMYSEMMLEHLSGAGDAIRSLGG